MKRVNFSPIHHIEIRDGQAYITGRNIKVKMVISRLVHGTNATIEEVMEQYDLSPAEAHSVVAYYYDHKVEVDQYFEEEEHFARENIPSLDDLKARLRLKKTSDEPTDN
ncbi:MAG: DUF433 domain-containing protein [Anaerolineae bacterium]